MNKLKVGMAAAVAVLLAAAGNAVAAPIPWSNPSGSASSFSWSNGGSDNGLFGSPTVVGDSLIFFPTNFAAVSANNNSANTSDSLQFDVLVKDGSELQGFKVSENGDYSILGTGSVKATGALFLSSLTDQSEPTRSQTLTTTPTFPVTSGAGTWSGAAQVNTPSGWTKFHVVVDNVLQATSDPNSVSQIDKKVSQLTITAVLVPEPASISLLLLGGGMLLARRRSR